MGSDHSIEFRNLIAKANAYLERALWQEQFRTLQEALAICEEPGFPEAQKSKQEVLYYTAGIWRRMGRYDRALKVLRQSLGAYPGPSSLFKASFFCELGVILKAKGKFLEAQQAFREQAHWARDSLPSVEAEIELCRALGNDGIVTFHLAQDMQPVDPGLLALASTQLRECIRRTRELHPRLLIENPKSNYVTLAKSWEIDAMDRLTLCHIAAGKTAEAVRLAQESQSRQEGAYHSSIAFSKLFYGNALWHNGQHDEALVQWNASFKTCSTSAALLGHPLGRGYTEILRLIANAGVSFDTCDEQGFSALDHAVLSGRSEVTESIQSALRIGLRRILEHDKPGISEEEIEAYIDDEISMRKRQAELRGQYRNILQEHIRPQLRTMARGSFRRLRQIYSQFLSARNGEQRIFSDFRYVKYTDFMAYGKLSTSSRLMDPSRNDEDEKDDFVIFFSYRWIGGDVPDDANGTQWRRMTAAVQQLLEINSHISQEKVGIWLDYACINQENPQEKAHGIDALPLAVIQCNAMISLVDETYYERAWCVVEVMLMRALMESYGLHQWWEHSPNGILKKGNTNSALDVDVTRLKLTKEKLDRPKIDFLVRQSRLLGRDNASDV